MCGSTDIPFCAINDEQAGVPVLREGQTGMSVEQTRQRPTGLIVGPSGARSLESSRFKLSSEAVLTFT